MNTQHLIKQTLSRPESVVVVQQILEDNREASRTAIAVRVCEEFDFFNARALVQTSGCLKALRELQQSKRLQLPEARENAVHRELRRLDSPLEEPDDLPASVEEIRELELIRVETESEVRVWNELMRPKTSARSGAVGRAQIRYLIRSEHGWLGGLAFSASALQRKDRDEWIGWNRDTRRQHLHRVINLSRFLIRSFLRCANRQPRGY